jgi:hypothetical protein
MGITLSKLIQVTLSDGIVSLVTMRNKIKKRSPNFIARLFSSIRNGMITHFLKDRSLK